MRIKNKIGEDEYTLAIVGVRADGNATWQSPTTEHTTLL